MQARGLDAIVRASLTWLHDEADVERLASAL
jgi:selenocysteine lyase/cysteine desulfurase